MKRSGVWRIAVGVVVVLVLVSGCRKRSKSVPSPNAPAPAPAPNGGGLQPGGINPGVFKTLPAAGRLNPSNDLKAIGLFYLNYADIVGRPPARLEDLADMKRDAPKIYQGIQDGVYVVCWNTPLTGATSETVLAYVRDAPTNGGVVLMLDGSVRNMSPQELQAAPKAGR